MGLRITEREARDPATHLLDPGAAFKSIAKGDPTRYRPRDPAG